MTFKHDGLLHRVAYDWYPDYRGDLKPQKTSVCKLFWLTVFAVLIGWPILVLGTRMLGWAVRIVGAIPAIVLFGYRPAGKEWRFLSNDAALPFVPIKGWPELAGDHVMPIVVLGILLVLAKSVAVLWKVVVLHFFMGTEIGTTTGQIAFAITFAVVVGVAVHLTIKYKVNQTEGWLLFKEMIAAKKNRWCPTVEFK